MKETTLKQKTCDRAGIVPSRNTAEQIYIDTDRTFTIVSMSEGADRRLGALRCGTSVLGLMSPEEAFRLEQFVSGGAKQKKITQLEVIFSGLPSFPFGYAVRQELFFGAAVRIWLFADRRDMLLSPPVLSRFGRLTSSASEAADAMAAATEAIGRISALCPEDAEILRQSISKLYMTGMTSAIIHSVCTNGALSHIPFDLRGALDAAMDNVTETLGGISLVCRGTDCDARFPVSVSFEHFLYLITSAVCAVHAIPHHGLLNCEANFGDGIFSFAVSAQIGEDHPAICESAGLLSLEELSPDASSRLFICDLICGECFVAHSIDDADGILTLRFELTRCEDTSEFMSRDPLPDRENVLHICRAIILGAA